jgi:hypothetical protein
MKLLLCKECHDVVRLQSVKRVCKCGKSGGRYTDGINAVYFGENAVPLGFSNSSLVNAVVNQPNNGSGKEFIAFVIPKVTKNCNLVNEENV